jgi:diguanylate cyclase (GGDEF)-like protein
MRQTVLAIDDSLEIHRLLEIRLQPERLQLEKALSGEEGLEKARTLQPDLILLDLAMPGQTGFQICRQLKADPQTAPIPVIFLSASSDVVDKVKGFDLGAVDYVTKPFDPAELRARVRAALRTKRYHDMLATRAQLDALTGLWNRRYFEKRLDDEVAAHVRYGRKACLIMLDIDHFKRINDTFGHPFGDQVLQATGEALVSSVRSPDTVCRYGGEEFALILPETGMSEGMTVAARVQRQLGQMGLQHRGQTVAVTASFGISSTDIFPAPTAASRQGLLCAADDALYEAKRGGRNCVRQAGRVFPKSGERAATP